MPSNWTKWKSLPSPEQCRSIEAPEGAGVYQIKNKHTKQLIQFGIGIRCQKRMESIFPKPYGVGTRNNESKRKYILQNWKSLVYRTISTSTKVEAKEIEDILKSMKNHLFNT